MADPPVTVEKNEDEDDGLEIEFTTFHAFRFKMFSDAVWAIIGTIMILPTMNITIADEIAGNITARSVTQIVDDILPDTGLYFLAFLIICTLWTCHVWTFQTMRKVNELSILVNLVVLMIASLLPYFYTLMSRFRSWKPVIIFCSLEIALGLLQISMIFHAFSYPNLLNTKIMELPETEKVEHKRMLLKRLVVTPILAFVAILLSFVTPDAAMVCLAIIPIFPWIQSSIVWCLSRFPAFVKMLGSKRRRLEKYIVLTDRLKKERIEVFSDGVFAITATLLVLNISEKYVPTKNEVLEDFQGNVMKALAYMAGIFLCYSFSFIVIGEMWYAQLRLFKNFYRISRLMLFINNLALACVGLAPLTLTFFLDYRKQISLTVGVRLGCVVIFSVYFLLGCLYSVGLLFDKYSKQRFVHKSAKPGGNEFSYICFQIISPLVLSAIVYGVAFLPNIKISLYVGVATLGVYTLLLILWKTIQATCFDKEEQNGYQPLPSSDAAPPEHE